MTGPHHCAFITFFPHLCLLSMNAMPKLGVDGKLVVSVCADYAVDKCWKINNPYYQKYQTNIKK